jgi:hypothetical protein
MLVWIILTVRNDGRLRELKDGLPTAFHPMPGKFVRAVKAQELYT